MTNPSKIHFYSLDFDAVRDLIVCLMFSFYYVNHFVSAVSFFLSAP